LKSTHYLGHVLRLYEKDLLAPGDPDYEWNQARSPIPSCMGGTQTVPLVRGHHLIHDLYQSEDFGRCCVFSSDVRDFLDREGFLCENWFELYDLLEKWSVIGAKAGGQTTYEKGVGVYDSRNKDRVREGNRQGGSAGIKMKVGAHAPGVSRKGGLKTVELRTGVHDPAKRQKVVVGGRRGGLTSAERGVGAHTPEIRRRGGHRTTELRVGIHAPGAASLAAKKTVEMGVGLHDPKNREKVLARARRGAKALHRKRICLSTGHISNPTGMAKYQRSRQIPKYLWASLDGKEIASQVALLGLAVI
jgi:hypothetical protein